jgi:hypothetical protein
MREMRKAYKIMIGKCKGKRSFEGNKMIIQH